MALLLAPTENQKLHTGISSKTISEYIRQPMYKPCQSHEPRFRVAPAYHSGPETESPYILTHVPLTAYHLLRLLLLLTFKAREMAFQVLNRTFFSLIFLLHFIIYDTYNQGLDMYTAPPP
jgi:hypothetical protein